ncbi:MAG: hypothetical protein ACE37F_08090 [Nannocystaceae bacterium]|nr:hypothetical protein [bacterium]
MHRAALFSALLVGACAPGADAPSVDPASSPSQDPLRVLVTGFNDWTQLGEPPNLWRCRDNPSCRLLVGDALEQPPTDFEGPLVAALQRAAGERSVQWSFATMPVTWGVATERTPYAEHDVVVHIGLGVYDRDDEVFVEAGAFNLRKGTDAAGTVVEAPILPGEPEVLEAPPRVAAAVAAVDGRAFGAMRARAMPARVENTYLCNETHTLALDAVAASEADGGRLEAAYFVHIPQPKDGDWATLAESVAGVVVALALR